MRPLSGLSRSLLGLLVALGLVAFASEPEAATLKGFARVRDDGTLAIQGHIIRLKGIYIPTGDRDCRTAIRPVRCANESVLVLDDLIEGFVHCQANIRLWRDGTRAYCSVEGDSILDPRQDLGALLIERGFALATDDAPFRYRALERLARAQQRGLWNPGIVNIR